MTKFIAFAVDGALTARYDSLINGDDIPPDAVSVSDELFVSTINELDGIWMLDRSSGLIEKRPTPPPTDAQLAAAAFAHRDQLLAAAAVRIAPLQDAEDLSMVTDAEQQLLTRWQSYRVCVSRVSQQAGFPKAIDWPQAPA